MRRFLTCVFVLTLAAGLLAGGAGPAGAVTQWEFSGPPGGSVEHIAVAPSDPSTIYVTLDNRAGDAGVSKTTDGGAHWADASTGLVNPFLLNGLVVDPTDADRVFIGSFDGVQRTVNGGGSWTTPSTDLNGAVVEDVAMNPNNPDVLYAATQNSKVWKSTDGGDNWQPKASGIPTTTVRHLSISASNPSVVYASTDDGVYKTTNGGGSWTKKNSGVSGFQASIAVDPTDSGTAFVGTENGLFRTTDGGSHWSASQSGIPVADRDVRSLLIDPDHPARVYAGADPGGLFASTNGGVTWTARNSGLDYRGVFALALDPSNTAKLYAGTLGGIFRSTNHGNAWNARNTGLHRTLANSVAVNPGNPDVVYIAAEGGGILKTTDGGVTWSPHNADIAPGGALVRAVAVDPQHHSTVFIGGLLDHPIAKSTDGGLNWQFEPSAAVLNPVDIAVSPVDSDLVWASGSGDGVWRTTNGGGHWAAAQQRHHRHVHRTGGPEPHERAGGVRGGLVRRRGLQDQGRGRLVVVEEQRADGPPRRGDRHRPRRLEPSPGGNADGRLRVDRRREVVGSRRTSGSRAAPSSAG